MTRSTSASCSLAWLTIACVADAVLASPIVREVSPRGRKREGARRFAPLRRKALKNGWHNKCRRNDRNHRSIKRQARHHLHTTCRFRRPRAELRSPMSLHSCALGKAPYRRQHVLIGLNVTRVASSSKRPHPLHSYCFLKNLWSTKFIYRLISR